ncbi:MAG: SLC13 family permease, partial [Acidobacteriota bacterium]
FPWGNPILKPEEAFSGFSRSAVITIIAIFIIADALQRTGVTEKVGSALLRIGGVSERRLTVAVMASGAFLSLFMNNIAAAAVLLPAVSGAAKKSGVSISKLMLPLAFATALGGMATLLTTSNIVLNSVLSDRGLEVFRLTDFAFVGIPATLVGILFIAVFGKRLLPGAAVAERTSNVDARDLVKTYHLGRSLFSAKIPTGSALIGRPLSKSTLREQYGVSVIAIERNGQKLLHIYPSTELELNDVLILEGDEAQFRESDIEPKLQILTPKDWTEEYLESRTIEVVEVMLAPRSRLIGSTLRDSRFRDKYGMNVLAIWRGDKEIVAGVADVKLEFGDALLLQGPRDRLSGLSVDTDLLLLMPKEQFDAPPRPGKGRVAFFI